METMLDLINNYWILLHDLDILNKLSKDVTHQHHYIHLPSQSIKNLGFRVYTG